MKKLSQSMMSKTKHINTTLVFLFLVSLIVTAQVRTTRLGAMNALNNGSVTSSPAIAVAVTPGIIVTTPANNTPIIGTGAGIIGVSNAGTIADMLSSKDLSLSYQSAYSWWSGYQDYKNAAASLSFNADGTQVELGDYGIYIPASIELRNAVNFFMEDTHFILFRDFGVRKVSLIIRGNQPVPVELMPDAGGYITYTPELTSFKTIVPLNLK
jgi:hypothetical protein